MPRIKTALLHSPPYAVAESLRRLGANLRTARIARNLTQAQAAEKIGTGTRVIAEAERGRPGTGIAVYLALLWAYDLLDSVAQLADPASDLVGLAAGARRKRSHAPSPALIDNEF